MVSSYTLHVLGYLLRSPSASDDNICGGHVDEMFRVQIRLEIRGLCVTERVQNVMFEVELESNWQCGPPDVNPRVPQASSARDTSPFPVKTGNFAQANLTGTQLPR